MKFHWFERASNNFKLQKLKDRIEFLEKSGYESVLLPLHTKQFDNFTTAAVLSQDYKKIKLMVACRPYLISPQYLYMLILSFNRMSQGRLIINLVHGHIQNDENFDGVIDIDGMIVDKKGRRDYMEKFLDKFYKIIDEDFNTEILISGGSQQTLDLVKKYSKISATNLDHFTRNRDWYSGIDRIFVHAFSKDLKENFYKTVSQLESLGITDILLSDDEEASVHDFVKEYSNANL